MTIVKTVFDTLSDVSTDSSQSEIETSNNISESQNELEISSQLEKDRKKAKRIRYRENKRKRFLGDLDLSNDPQMLKWWNRRYDLFWKFDEGIQLDKEAWFSVTPETIARRQADVCRTDVIIDAFCGVGGNSVNFPRTCSLTISIDIDFNKLLKLKHNCGIYACTNTVEPIQGNVVTVLKSFRPGTVDIIFMSPPWGGPGYSGLQMPPGSSSWNTKKRRRWFLEQQNLSDAPIEEPYNLEKIECLKPSLYSARIVSNRICVYLPRNCSIGQILQLGWPLEEQETEPSHNHSSSLYTCLPVKIEDYWLRGRRIALSAYLGSFPILELTKNTANLPESNDDLTV